MIVYSEEMLYGGYANKATCCSLCERSFGYPFMIYTCGKTNIFICDKCAAKNGKGIMADLVELKAAHDLRVLGYEATDRFKDNPVSCDSSSSIHLVKR